MRSFLDHHMLDWAAALTFYAAISLIPALVIIVGVVGIFGDGLIDELAANLQDSDPGPARSIALDAVDEVRTSSFSAGVALLAGIAGALWTASSYVGSFLRASGVIRETPTRHPFWRLRPIQLLVTCGVIVAITASALAVVVTGPLAEQAANLVGVDAAAAAVWDVAKWPAIGLAVMTIFAVLYWAAPETRGAGFRWITPGAVVAATAWMVGSGAYAFYVSQFPDYNKVYGSLGAAIGFLAWLWASNMALLYGAELNALADRAQRESEAPGSST